MNPTLWIYRKETREMLRDKRVRGSALVMPFLIVFATFFLIGMIVNSVKRPDALKLHAVNVENPIAQALKEGKVTLLPVPSEEEAEKMVREGKARLVLVFPKAAGPGGQTVIKALFDPKEERARITVSQMGAQFAKLSSEALKVILKEKGIPPEAANPIVLEEKPVQVGGKESAAGFLVQMLPYLIVIWAFFGGMGLVGDLVAGEKEKLTLETLLISPVSRTQIALGKFFALAQVGFFSSCSALLAVVVAGTVNIPILKAVFDEGMGLSIGMVITIILVLIPTSMLFAAVMLAVSAFAKNTREAQTHLTLVSFIILMPAMMSQVIGYMDFAKTTAIYFIPVLNTSAVIRNALMGKSDALGLLITIGSSLVLASLALSWAISLFKREQILVRI